MKKESRPVYVSDDGQVFATEAEAEEHEKKEREKAKAFAKLKTYSVNHGFDATEGRGYFASTYVVTDASRAVILQWCLDKFGAPLSQWYGDGFFEVWHLSDALARDVSHWVSKKGDVPGCGHRPTEIAVVSTNDFSWAGLPKSEFPWPRKKKA